MSNLSHKLLSNLSKTVPAVKIEKASADANNGLAKIVFSTNLPANQQISAVRNASVMEQAFATVLGDKARILPETIHRVADTSGYYFGFIKTNTQVVAEEDAVKEGSGYHMVAANVFADDADEHIWEVTENADGKRVLMRNTQEDLTELFNNVAPPANMSTAAASIGLTGSLEFASLVTFLDPATQAYHNGIMLDNSTAYDFDAKTSKKINSTLAIAGTDVQHQIKRDLNAKFNDDHKTFAELADANVNEIYLYLDTLYASAPAFLAAYKAAVARLIDLPAASRY